MFACGCGVIVISLCAKARATSSCCFPPVASVQGTLSNRLVLKRQRESTRAWGPCAFRCALHPHHMCMWFNCWFQSELVQSLRLACTCIGRGIYHFDGAGERSSLRLRAFRTHSSQFDMILASKRCSKSSRRGFSLVSMILSAQFIQRQKRFWRGYLQRGNGLVSGLATSISSLDSMVALGQRSI
eukprot:3781823-Amphidinium_carterae.1